MTTQSDILEIVYDTIAELYLERWKGFTPAELKQAIDDGTVTYDDINATVKRSIKHGLEMIEEGIIK